MGWARFLFLMGLWNAASVPFDLWLNRPRAVYDASEAISDLFLALAVYCSILIWRRAVRTERA